MKPDIHFPEQTAKELLLQELDALTKWRDNIHRRVIEAVKEAVEEVSEVNTMIAERKKELEKLCTHTQES